jgi:hypothetical protein
MLKEVISLVKNADTDSRLRIRAVIRTLIKFIACDFSTKTIFIKYQKRESDFYGNKTIIANLDK